MIYWNENLSVGIEVIDEDHKGLFLLINTIELAIQNETGLNSITSAIDALNEYADGHFKREESLMILCGYTGQDFHESEHDQFREIVKSLRKLHYLCPDMVSVPGTIAYLNKWLIEHIAHSDNLYVEQMKKNKSIIDIASNNYLNTIRECGI